MSFFTDAGVCCYNMRYVHVSGKEGGEYILHITILLSASTPAVHDTAKLDSLPSFAAPESQQVRHCKMPASADLEG